VKKTVALTDQKQSFTGMQGPNSRFALEETGIISKNIKGERAQKLLKLTTGKGGLLRGAIEGRDQSYNAK